VSHNPAMYAVVVAVVLLVAGVSLVGVLVRSGRSHPGPLHRDRAHPGTAPRPPD
jgi:hypothetical protein